MTISQKFCTQCGQLLEAGIRFCGNCGATVGPDTAPPLQAPESAGAPPPPVQAYAAPAPRSEEVTGIVPFVDYSTGFTSSESGLLIVTESRIIFARLPPAFEPVMKAEREKIREELKQAQGDGLGTSSNDERRFYGGLNWVTGPWQRYASMSPDAIVAETPGNLSILFAEVGAAKFINAKGSSRSDSLDILAQGKKFEFTIMFALGPATLTLLRQYLGDRASDLMATWGTVDTVATLLGGKHL